ncbi:MAG: type IV pilus biogenesis protein PilP [Bdellovibrionales bacterium]|jgi:type IV pilus biogenesis protein PilP
MKIAAKTSLIVIALAFGLVSGFSSLARAEDSVSSPPPGPSTQQEKSSVKEVLDSIKVPESSQPVSSKEKTLAEDKGDEGMTSPKVPDSVKGVVKRLNTATKDVTIEDLNSAREAVVKLDVLIDIEKRLNDLTTLRQEREEKESTISGALPAGAFGGNVPPPSLSPSALAPVPAAIPPVVVLEKDVDVTKIMGASGRYVASIKTVDGEERRVKAGDKLPDGSVIDSVSRNGVTVLSPSKKRTTIQVKDISAVFGGR